MNIIEGGILRALRTTKMSKREGKEKGDEEDCTIVHRRRYTVDDFYTHYKFNWLSAWRSLSLSLFWLFHYYFDCIDCSLVISNQMVLIIKCENVTDNKQLFHAFAFEFPIECCGVTSSSSSSGDGDDGGVSTIKLH